MNPALSTYSAVAQRYYPQGYNCELKSNPPGVICSREVRDTDEVVVPLTGTVEVEVAGQTHHPEKGDEVVIPAWAEHTIRNTGDSEAEWCRCVEQDVAQTD